MTCPADSFALSVFFSVVYDPEITDAFFCLLYHLLLKRPAKVVYMTVEKRYACHSSYIAAIVEQNWKHLTRKRENGQNLLLLLYCTIKENFLFLVLVKFPTQRLNFFTTHRTLWDDKELLPSRRISHWWTASTPSFRDAPHSGYCLSLVGGFSHLLE